MGLMDLTELERLQVSTSLLLTVILFIIGIKITMKYFEHKWKEFIGVGLSIFFMGAGQIMKYGVERYLDQAYDLGKKLTPIKNLKFYSLHSIFSNLINGVDFFQ